MAVGRDVLGGLALAGALATRGDPAEQALRRLGGGVLLIDCGAVDAGYAENGIERTDDVLQAIAAVVEQACAKEELLYRVDVGKLLMLVPSAKTFGMVLQRAEALRASVEVAAGDSLRTVIVGVLARRGMLPYPVVQQRLWETLEHARAAGRRCLIYREHATLTPVQVTVNVRPPGCAQPVVMPVVSPASGRVVAWWVTAEQATWLDLSDAMFASLAPLITATPSPVPVILDVDSESLECLEQAALLLARARAALATVDVQVAWTFRGATVEPGSARAKVIEELQRANMPVLLRAQVVDGRVLASLASLAGVGIVLDAATWATVEPSELCVPLVSLANVRGAMPFAIGVRTTDGATLLGRVGVLGVAGEWVGPAVRPEHAANVVATLHAETAVRSEKAASSPVPTMLPMLPGVLARLHRISDDGGDELLTLASSDPLTALRLLVMASADLEPGAPMLTLAEALVRVGTANFRSIYLRNAVGEVFLPNQWATTRMWLHPVQTALWAGALTRLLAIDEFGEAQAYLVGLLHDVGRIALYQRDARGLARADSDGLRALADTPLAEHRVFQTDHATFGADLCRRWGLQERFVEVIRLHHVLTPVTVADPVSLRLLRVVQVSDLLSEQMMLGREGLPAREAAIQEVLRRVSGAPRVPIANTVRLWDLVAAEAQRRMLKVGLDHLG